MRLIDYFDRGADLYPDRHCLHDGAQGWTYKEVRAQTRRQRPAGGGPGTRLEGRGLQRQPALLSS
jgi:hypothetical protein